MRHRLRASVTGLAVAGLVLSGCGNAPESASENTDTSEYPSAIDLQDDYDPDATFRFGYNGFPVSWDPIESVSSGDRVAYAPIYDTLFIESQEEPGYVPGLATSFEAGADGKSLTLSLREGLAFSDGTPFDAEAVKFNLDRNRADDSKLRNELASIESVEVIDPLTVKINVSGGVQPTIVSLVGRGGIMVSPVAAQAGTLASQPVGIGPYVATEIVAGDHVAYELSPDYWDPEAQKVAKREVILMTNDQTRYNALLSGEVDGARINSDQIEDAVNAGIQVTVKPSALFIYFSMNTSVAPFDNVEVRKAVNMAIDREGISQGLYDGHCTPQVQPSPEGSVGYSEEVGDGLDIYPYDPDQAQEILEENGVTDLSFETVTLNITIYQKFAEVVQANFKDIGVDVSVKPVPSAQRAQEFVIGQSVPTTSTVSTGIIDPDYLFNSYLAPEAAENPGGTLDPEIAKYANEGATALEEADRTAAYEEMVDAWMENPPHLVPVCMLHLAGGFADNVSGPSQNVSGISDLRYIAVAAKE